MDKPKLTDGQREQLQEERIEMEAALRDELSYCPECGVQEIEAGICLGCSDCGPIWDRIEDIRKTYPSLAFILGWARCGISERSGDMTRDYYELLKHARKVVGL